MSRGVIPHPDLVAKVMKKLRKSKIAVEHLAELADWCGYEGPLTEGLVVIRASEVMSPDLDIKLKKETKS